MNISEITEVRDVRIGEDVYVRISNEEMGTTEYYDTEKERKLDR
jgi:hypothetical protein